MAAAFLGSRLAQTSVELHSICRQRSRLFDLVTGASQRQKP